MKIKILLNLGRGLPDFMEDDIKEVPKDVTEGQAKKLIAQGLAEEVREEAAAPAAKEGKKPAKAQSKDAPEE